MPRNYTTIKSDRIDFEKLLNGLDPLVQQQQEVPMPNIPQPTNNPAATVDNTSAAELMNVRAFEFDYESTRKGLRKKARKTILGMVNHIIPSDIINEDYIQDKIEQDIEAMTELYMQLENNKIMQKSLMDDVSRGNKAPRMYEVFGQITDRMQAINKQIIDTEQRIRKTYVDLKYEVRDKANEDFGNQSNGDNLIGLGNNASQNGVIVTSTKNLISGAKKRHIEQLLDAKETEFEET